jgi:hypothetical protein
MKIIAHYLPQYHEFEPNNTWWGKGFTEWTCVKRAKSLCEYHRIKKPHPDIGYYNLLEKEVRKKQGDLAKKYFIYGFCYYHYWFGTTVLMDKTLQLMLQDGYPDLPFCFSWANEPWTRRMNGGNGELLQPNNYGQEEEWDKHLDYLIKFFKSKNYILINNKPLFLIYRTSQIPNCEKRLNYWRYKLKKEGFDGLYVVMTIGNFNDNFKSMCPFVDASVDFNPAFLRDKNISFQQKNNSYFFDMKKSYDIILNTPTIHETHFRGTMVGFDSSPRNSQISNIFVNGSAEIFGNHLNAIMGKTNEKLLFINAWNEWGEGCALEPEEIDCYSYLEQVKKVLFSRGVI